MGGHKHDILNPTPWEEEAQRYTAEQLGDPGTAALIFAVIKPLPAPEPDSDEQPEPEESEP